MDKMNPWAGLASYQDGDKRLFCGRDNESFDVAKLIDNHIFVTLYGKSGVGKTSLLKAGVFPRLRAMGYLPVDIRLGLEADTLSFQDCIVLKLQEALIGVGTSTTLNDRTSLPANQADETWLWSYFARTRITDSDGKVLFPVFLFDQFEEAFRNRPKDTATLLRQIHFMADESHAIEGLEGYQYDFNFRFVASLREDELYRLEDCLDENYLWELKTCRFRLRGLSEQGASEVISKPGSPFLKESEKEVIIDALLHVANNEADNSISTNILSLICSRVYEEMLRSEAKVIDLSLVKRVIEGNPFEKYYLEAIEGFPKSARIYIEDELVDTAERRNSVSEHDFMLAVPHGDLLINDGPRKILQRVSVASGANQTRIELVHDSFCHPLATFRAKRKLKKRFWGYLGITLISLLLLGVSFSIIYSLRQRQWKMLENQSRFAAEKASQLIYYDSDYLSARRLLAAVLPKSISHPKDRPYVERTASVFWESWNRSDGILRGHITPVQTIDLSPNGEILVSGDRSGYIRFWDAHSGKTIGEPMKAHEQDVKSALFILGGERIATASTDGTIQMWDAQTLQRIGLPLRGHSKGIETMAYHPDLKYLASASADGTIRIWNAETGAPVTDPLYGHSDVVRSIAFSPNGKLLASCSDDETILIWDVSSGKPVGQPLKGHEQPISSIAFCRDGKYLASGSWDGKIILWDTEKWVMKGTPMGIKGSSFSIKSLQFSPDGEWIACGQNDGIIRLWETSSGKPLKSVLKGHKRSVDALTFSVEGTRLYSASADGNVRIWDGENRSQVGKTLEGHKDIVRAVLWSRDGQWIASGSYDGTICIRSSEQPTDTITILKANGSAVTSLSLSAQSNHLAAGFQDGSIRLWNPATWEAQTFPSTNLHTQGVTSLSFDEKGKRLASCSYDGRILLWSLDKDPIIADTLCHQPHAVLSVAFHPSAELLASGSYDGSIQLWDPHTLSPVNGPMNGHRRAVTSVAFSPDGEQLASGSYDGNIIIWDIHQQQQNGEPLSGENKGVESIEYSPDGSLLSAGLYDGTISLWDTRKAIPIRRPIPGHRKRVFSLSFSPDGNRLVSGSADTTVRIWNISLQEMLDKTRKEFPPLSLEEREEYYLE